MKVRIKKGSIDAAYREAIGRIHAAHPDGLPNIVGLKRQVSLEAIIAFSLDAAPEIVRGESRWCCPFHPDTHPSLWARDDHRDSGIGRWGCNPCGISGDVYDFLERLHSYTKAEALRWVKVWQTNHRPAMRIRLRGGARREFGCARLMND